MTRPSSDLRLRVAAVLLTLGGCKDPEPTPEAPPTPEPLVARWAGCLDLRAKGGRAVCYAQPGTVLRFFVPDVEPDTPLEVWHGDAHLGAKREDLPTGARLTVTLAGAAHPVRVVRPAPLAAFELSLAPLDLPPALVDARDKLGVPEQHAALATQLEALTASDDEIMAAKAKGLAARLHVRRGEHEAAVALYRETIEAHRRLRLVRDEHRDRFALFFRRVFEEGRLEEQHALLAPLDDLAGLAPLLAARRDYYAGVARLDSGAFQLSLELEERAMRALGELADPSQDDARFNVARILRGLGRYDEMRALLEQTAANRYRAQAPCLGAPRLLNLGFFAYEVERNTGRGVTSAPAPRNLVDEAMRTMEQRCPSAHERGQMYLTTATVLLAEDDLSEARRALDEAEAALTTSPHFTLFLRAARGRLALKSGELERALQVFRRLAADAAPLDDPEAQRNALLGEARTLIAMGKPSSALDLLERAEQILDEQVARMPLGLGREPFLANNEAFGALHVQLLLDAERPREAQRVALRGHQRAVLALGTSGAVDRLDPELEQDWLRALREYREVRREALQEWSAQPELWTVEAPAQRKLLARRGEWSLKIKEKLNAALRVLRYDQRGRHRRLLKPAPGRGTLAVHPVPSGGWVAFLEVGDRLRWKSVPSDGRRHLSPSAVRRLLDELGIVDMKLERLEILDSAALQTVDLARVDVDGQPLVDRVELVHVLDLGERPPPADKRPRALLVASDPGDTLARDRDEATLAQRALEEAGFGVTVLEGARATVAAVGAALSDPAYEVFHFVGHGNQAGTDGWQSGLLMAEGQRFTVGDLLLLPRVPPRVILSACSSGKSGAGNVAAGVGLAQAFIVRGAHTVIGTVELVDDEVSFGFMRSFYRGGGALDPVGSFHDAAREQGSAARSFRVWQRR